MGLKDLTEEGVALKIIFDGYDFLQHDVGKMLISNKLSNKVKETTYLPTLYDEVDKFLSYCDENLNNYHIEHYITTPIMCKYKVGIYSLTDCLDEKNPWKGNPYILFNNRIIKPLFDKYPFLKNVSFWVCPSFNEKGKCEAIGFRVTDKDSVLDSFKWLFTCGNNIIYGKNTVNKNKDCYIVEGFRDYVALNELGYNVIGLGSVVISKIQEEYINTLTNPILLLDNDNFGLKKSLQYKDKYRISTLVNTTEKDAYDTWIKYNNLEIMEIK